MAKVERHCTLLVSRDESRGAPPSLEEIATDLQSKDMAAKVEALKNTIMMHLNGEDPSKLLMTVIQYCLTKEDHTLQKLLQVYWEVVDKYGPGGELKPEMILVWCVAPAAAAAASRQWRAPPLTAGRRAAATPCATT